MNYTLFFALTLIGFGIVSLVAAGIGLECRALGRDTWLRNFTLTAIVLGAAAGLITGLATQSLLCAIWCVIGLAGAIMGNYPFYNHFHTRRATKFFEHAKKVREWGLANFDRMVSNERDSVTSLDLERILRNSTTSDADRRILSWVLANIKDVGHEMEVYRSYDVRIDLEVEEIAVTNEVFGISRADFESYPNRVRQTTTIGGWLPMVDALPRVTR